MPQNAKEDDLVKMTAGIVSSHLSNAQTNATAEEIPGLIKAVYKTLGMLKGRQPVSAGMTDPPQELVPAVPVAESVTDDYIICLEDGRKLKMLKRYLKSAYNITPEEYRKRWNLPLDYPMVAPGYARRRSDLARKMGLGRKMPSENIDEKKDQSA